MPEVAIIIPYTELPYTNYTPHMGKPANTARTTFADGIGHQLRRASQACAAAWQQQRQDLTQPQFAVLAALAEYGAQDQTGLGRLTSIDKSTLAALVDRLDDRGLISKTIDPENRRRRQIQLTDAGRERCTLAYEQAAATERWIADALGDAGAEQLRALLRTLADAPPPT